MKLLRWLAAVAIGLLVGLASIFMLRRRPPTDDVERLAKRDAKRARKAGQDKARAERKILNKDVEDAVDGGSLAGYLQRRAGEGRD